MVMTSRNRKVYHDKLKYLVKLGQHRQHAITDKPWKMSIKLSASTVATSGQLGEKLTTRITGVKNIVNIKRTAYYL